MNATHRLHLRAKQLLLAGLIALTTFPLAAMEKVVSVEGMTEYQLDNGMRVLLIPDASRPTTTVNVTYLVGSRHEGYGESGMAHLLEHLLFKSTTNFDNITEEISRRGGRANGTTWYDRTNYFQTFPASEENLEWSLSMEADRMVNALLKKEDLDSEMTVVRNEFERGENSPFRILMQRTMAVANEWHGYGRSTIGARTDVENVPIERLRAFYKKYYQPDNAILVLSGNFDEADALAMIEDKFGSIEVPERTGAMIMYPTYTRNPTQDGERSVTLRRTGDEQMVIGHFHGPAAAHPDFTAFQVLSHVLGNEPSGRLYKAIVDTELATSTGAFSPALKEPGFLLTYVQLRDSQSIEDVEKAMVDVVHSFAEQPVTEEELERARSALLRNIELTLRSSDRVGIQMSEAAAAGDWRGIFLQRDRLKEVELEAVNRVAQAYFVPSNRTVGRFIPTDNPVRAEIPKAQPIEELVAGYQGGEEQSAGEQFEPTFDNIEDRLQRYELDNGLKVALLPKSTRGETIRGRLTLRLGTEETLTGRGDAFGAAASMLMRGTEERDRQEIQDAINAMQSTLSVNGSAGRVNVYFETTRDQFEPLMALMLEVLQKPAFDETEFEQLRQRILAFYESQQSDPGALANRRLSRLFNTTDNPEHPNYSATLEEDIASWENLELEDVRSAYGDFAGVTSGATMALVGDFDVEQAKALIEQGLGGWNAELSFERIPSEIANVEGQKVRIQVDDKANANMLGMLQWPMDDTDPDYAGMAFSNYLLGGGFLNSRLATRIRVEEGISYGVGSFLNVSSMDPRASMGFYASYAPDNSERLFAALNEELTRMLQEPVSDDELNKGLEGWLQAQEVSRGDDSRLVNTLASDLYLGRTMDYQRQLEEQVKALDADAIMAVFNKYLELDDLVLVEAGDFRSEEEKAAE
jgi:zinc protease